MGEILFLSHRIPFPPDRGDKIRSHHVLKALSRIAPVHVATFADDAEDHRHEGALAGISASYCLVERRKHLAVSGMEALASGRPLSLAAFQHQRLSAYVREVLRTRPIEAIYVFSGQMAQYVPARFTGRVVADLVDVDSAKFEAYGERDGGVRGWMERREGRLLRAEESRIAQRADATLLVSEAEAQLLRSRLPDGGERVGAMGNGLDATFFDPATVSPQPALAAEGAPRLIFTGQMDYAPNIEAAMRAIERVLPRVRESYPEASLHIVGRNPTPALQAFDGRNGVRVWGRVEDIRPWLAGADAALVPLSIARGVQNKVLEALAMGLPTVLTPGAATGIEACDGRDFIIGDTDDALADAVVGLAGDPVRRQVMGRAARGWILANADWGAALAGLAGHLGMTLQGDAVEHAA